MNNCRGISYYLKANREPGEISTFIFDTGR